MSKIEKALTRARVARQNQLVVVPGGLSVPPEGAREYGAGKVPTTVTTGTGLEQRVASTEAIARMREPQPVSKETLVRRGIIYPESPDNAIVQAFRELRTRIIQRSPGRNSVVMVTSVSGGGGSSFVALNLGAAFAFESGKTALVMDCNLRRPSLQRLLPEGQRAGLTDYLESPSLDLSEVIHPVGIERLRIIPAGSQREVPVEYFTAAKMNLLMDAVRQRYRERYVVLDAPPMTDSADTQILSELSDYVLLVVRHGKDTRAEIEKCVKAIDERKFLGFVFNDEPQPPPVSWTDWLPKFVRNFVRGRSWARTSQGSGIHAG